MTLKKKKATSKIKYRQIKNIKQLIRYHVDNCIPHSIIQTGNTNKLTSEIGNYIGYETYLKKRDLILISKVKNHIEKNQIKAPKKVKNIDYVTKLMPEIDLNKELYAVDISAAYWCCAKNLNFIDEELFKEGFKKKYSKKGRLISIGALASQPTLCKFDGKKYVYSKFEELPTANIFYKCAEVVNDLINNIAFILGKDFVFFWVDCVFFYEKKNIQVVENLFKNANFDCHTEKIISIAQDYKKKIITVTTDKKTSNFFFKKNE